MNDQKLQRVPMEKNLEKLNKLYSTAFEYFRKNSKKDPKYQEFTDCCNLLKDINTNFSSYEQIRTYSLLLACPLPKCSNKFIEKIITIITEIITNNLLDPAILQEMIDKFFQFLKEPKEDNSGYTDDTFNIKILNFFILIYTCDQISIHGDHLKFIVKIGLAIFLSKKGSQNQLASSSPIKTIIECLINKIKVVYFQTQKITGGVSNKNFYKRATLVSNRDVSSGSNEISNNNSENNSTIHRDNIYPTNEYTYFSKQYINFMVDLIEIKNLNKDNADIINKYISILKKEAQNSKGEIKSEIEKLKLQTYENIKNEQGISIGKFGWCIYCRNSANSFSNVINFPVCTNNDCENEFLKIGNTIDNEYKFENNLYRKDYIKIIKYLSKTSSMEIKNSEAEQVHSKCRAFCLTFIKQMIEQGSNYFTNDFELIKVIEGDLIGSLVKNTLSSDIIVLKQSIKLFFVIIKRFREHLKEQIEIFINKVLIAILESENLTMEYKEVVLSELLDMKDDCLFFVEIYVNYDCDVNYKTVFYDLINVLTKIIYGLYRKPQYANTIKPLDERKLRLKCLAFLSNFIEKLSREVEQNNGDRSTNFNRFQDAVNESVYQDIDETNMTVIEPTVFMGELKDKINKNLQVKALLTKAINKFISNGGSSCLNFLKVHKMIYDEETFTKYKKKYIETVTSPNYKGNTKILFNLLNEYNEDDLSSLESSEQINIMETPFISNISSLPFLLQTLTIEEMNNLTYEDFTAFEMARFLRSNAKELKREKLGDYLCSGKDFNKKIARYFIHSFNFKSLHILEALRILFADFPLEGEGQIIQRVILFFGEKYHKDNPGFNADSAFYVAFSLMMLNTDLHRDEVEKKMSINEFVQGIQEMEKNAQIDPPSETKFLEDCYYRVRDNPLVIPGRQISTNKNKQDLIKQEKENIINAVERTGTRSLISNNYIKDVDNDNIKQLIECSWSNFLGIFSQLLADFDDEKIVTTCITNILRMAGTCGILHLDTIEEAYIKTITNATNMMEGREINAKNVKCLEELIDFVITYGKNIRKCWYIILIVISKIDFYYSRQIDNDLFAKEIRKKSKLKNPEKELEIELKNYELLIKYKFDLQCETIFSKTQTFEKDAILNFIQSLCQVSTRELEDYATPRVYSLRKLIEVCDFNIDRIQMEWAIMWKLISEYLEKVITESQDMIIWNDALGLLRQSIEKLLKKRYSLEEYNEYSFQMDFFRPFEHIFSKTDNQKEEVVLQSIYYIVGTYTQNINLGWIVIFNILKAGLKKKSKNINEHIKKTLSKLLENPSVFFHREIFRAYIGCLSNIYLDKDLKQYAFESILNVLSRIISEKGGISEESKDKKEIKCNKFELLKIFFYGFDDLMAIDVIEHLNLLFEIIAHNKDLIFSSDIRDFINAYYCFFKPHLVTLILYFCNFSPDYFESNENMKQFQFFEKIEKPENIAHNINSFLEFSLENQINLLQSKNSEDFENFVGQKEYTKDNKEHLICFMKNIKKSFEKDLFLKKIKILSKFDEKNYEMALEFFLEKILEMLAKIEDQQLNYQFFFEDLIQSISTLSLFSKFSDINYKILSKVFQNKTANFNQKFWHFINAQNMNYLSLLSTTKIKIDENNIEEIVNFSFSFINFLISLFENMDEKLFKHTKNNFYKIYKYLSVILDIHLQIDTESQHPNYNLPSNKKTIVLLSSIEKLKKIILEKIDNIEQLYDSSCITCLGYFGKIFKKYNLSLEEDSPIINVIQFELDTILPKFLKMLNQDELGIVFDSMIDFVDSMNKNLRNSAKLFLKQFVNNKLCMFVPYNVNKSTNNSNNTEVEINNINENKGSNHTQNTNNISEQI